MSGSPAKIRVKVGSIELDYEGESSFITDGLGSLLLEVSELSNGLNEGSQNGPSASMTSVSQDPATSKTSLSTASIAARMNAKSGPDLAVCAMAHLELAKGQANNKRADILDEMKTASGYYKSSMSGNNASNLAGLVKAQKVNLIGSNAYCLSAAERKKVEQAIAADG